MQSIPVMVSREPRGTVSELIYGQFIEHILTCIQGGVYDPGNPLSDEKGIRTCLDEQGDILQTTWYDAQGNDLRQTAGEYETVYEYDDRGNQTGWVSYKNGELYDRYEARYDDQNRQIWGGRYDADGNLKSQFDYIYDDSVYTRTVPQADGSKRIEYYHADGRPHMIEDYNSEGKLTMLQRYYYQDILIPAKEE